MGSSHDAGAGYSTRERDKYIRDTEGNKITVKVTVHTCNCGCGHSYES